MADLLQAQADAKPTSTISDMEALERMSVIQEPSTTTLAPYSVQPALNGVVDNSAVLQRLTEMETMIQGGFDKIAAKLANTMIKAAEPAVTHAGGRRLSAKRRKSKRKYRTRSK